MRKWRLRGTERIDAPDIVSLLGEGTSFHGELTLQGGARIDGKLSGRLVTPSLLVVGPSGEIDADELHAADVTVCGTVRGKLFVRDRLEVRPGGRVHGHVVMRKEGLVVAPGGIFEGVIEYAEAPEAAGGEVVAESTDGSLIDLPALAERGLESSGAGTR